mmetsp:Transcript_16725/g.31666  ORF Transcript_16725/g.31666 Transcript_16725/m.31666 type:complete len:97 (+) Transcript_16725:785-1075(+)
MEAEDEEANSSGNMTIHDYRPITTSCHHHRRHLLMFLQTKELMAENQKLGVQRGKELEETSQQAGEVEEEAKKAMDTFKQLRLQSQKKDPLGFLNF